MDRTLTFGAVACELDVSRGRIGQGRAALFDAIGPHYCCTAAPPALPLPPRSPPRETRTVRNIATTCGHLRCNATNADIKRRLAWLGLPTNQSTHLSLSLSTNFVPLMVARHFLCCLPLRLGALLISACQLVLVGLLAAASWYTVNGLRTFPKRVSTRS